MKGISGLVPAKADWTIVRQVFEFYWFQLYIDWHRTTWHVQHFIIIAYGSQEYKWNKAQLFILLISLHISILSISGIKKIFEIMIPAISALCFFQSSSPLFAHHLTKPFSLKFA